jgi:hypothetical protein
MADWKELRSQRSQVKANDWHSFVCPLLQLSPYSHSCFQISVVSQLPQPLRFATEFTNGPNGYLLQSVKTSSDIKSDSKWESTFGFAYQLFKASSFPPSSQSLEPRRRSWRYSINDCKVVSGITVGSRSAKVKVASVPRPPTGRSLPEFRSR